MPSELTPRERVALALDHQQLVRDAQSGFEAHYAEWCPADPLGFQCRQVRCVICGHYGDASTEDGFDQRFAVIWTPQGWVHLEITVI